MKTLRQWYRWIGPTLLFLLLIVVMRLAESQASKNWLETQAYTVVQWGLGLVSHADGVVVVDIADLPPDKGVTPRPALLDLMARLKDAGALAIGVDVDFSPENNLFVAPDDPRFFEDCLSLHMPIFLGVARTAGNGREAWLGKREFAPLAAGIVIPEASGTVTEAGAPGPYPLFIPRLDSEGSRDELPSMAMALASVAKPDVERELTTPGWFSEPIVERTVIKGVAVPEFPVNYGFVRQLKQDSEAAKWDGGTFRPIVRSVAGKIVLIGDLKGSSESDVFATRGGATSASGVLIHASATLTLMNRPLRVLNEWARGGVELALVAWIGAALGASGKNKSRKERKMLRWKRWGLAVALPVAVAGSFWAGIIWLDWIAVPVVAVIHSFLKKTEEPAEDAAKSRQQVAAT